MADEAGSALAKLEPVREVAQVRADLERARSRLSFSARALKADLEGFDVAARVKASVSQRPLLWLTGAFAVGALLGKLSRRII